jgi:hypothetical protein
LLNGPESIIVARLAQVEVSSAIVRRGRQGGVSIEHIQAVLTELDRELSQSFNIIELSTEILARAIALTRAHGIRAADAIQLACALAAARGAGQQELVLVGSDTELNGAADKEGLRILDPTQP